MADPTAVSRHRSARSPSVASEAVPAMSRPTERSLPRLRGDLDNLQNRPVRRTAYVRAIVPRAGVRSISASRGRRDQGGEAVRQQPRTYSTHDLRRDRPSRAQQRPTTNGSELRHLQGVAALQLPLPRMVASIPLIGVRANEWATKFRLKRQRPAESLGTRPTRRARGVEAIDFLLTI